MEYSTTDSLPGEEVAEVMGIAHGNTIEARHLGADLFEEVRNLTGGALNGYSEQMWEAREAAIDKMLEDAWDMGADGVVNVRFNTNKVATTAAGVTAYGTAVTFE